MRFDSLVACGQVEPDLEQVQRVWTIGVNKGKHLTVDDTIACSHPLQITATIPPSVSLAIGVVDGALDSGR